ncbi:MAG: hypothetical protein MK052_10045 [Alphaproteobacteria bacterium]|nr:hypothetical protein [Alphaproteobacteria bacterium]
MKENNKSMATLVIVLAVLVIGYVLWISYANKKVREIVDNSVQRIEQRLSSNGNEATVTYDDVKVHGMSLRPRASLYKLHIKLEDTRRRREMHVMVPEVIYIPKTFNMDSYTLEVVDGVSATTSEVGKAPSNMLIDFSSAPRLNVDHKSNGMVEYNLDVPQNISIADADEADVEANQKTEIAFASAPTVFWSETPSGIDLDQKASFPHTVITHDGEAFAQMDSLSLSTKHSDVPNNLHNYDTTIKLENLTFAVEELMVLNPVSVLNEFEYTGPVPSQNESNNSQPMDIKLKNLAYMSGLVSILANGEVHTDPSEKMPYGNLMVRIDDIDRFFAYAREQRPNVDAYLTKIRGVLETMSGAEIEENGNVVINIVREAGGRLQVGELTLEETLGLFIELAMQMPNLSAPAQPSEPKASAEETAVEPSAADMVEEEVSPSKAATMEEELPESNEKAVTKPVAKEEGAEDNAATGDALKLKAGEKAMQQPADMDANIQPSKADVQVEIRTNADDVNVDVVDMQDAEADNDANKAQPSNEAEPDAPKSDTPAAQPSQEQQDTQAVPVQ